MLQYYLSSSMSFYHWEVSWKAYAVLWFSSSVSEVYSRLWYVLPWHLRLIDKNLAKSGFFSCSSIWWSESYAKTYAFREVDQSLPFYASPQGPLAPWPNSDGPFCMPYSPPIDSTALWLAWSCAQRSLAPTSWKIRSAHALPFGGFRVAERNYARSGAPGADLYCL